MVTTRFAALLAGALLAVTGCTGAGGEARETTASQGDGLLARLRDGGFTIVIRHAATDRSRPDAATVDLDDCATQRNLSAQGRADAKAIGAAVGRLDIPIGEVWASPYCRSKDTAELAFGRFEVVAGLERLYPERDERADERLNRRIVDRAPSTGEPNLIISGHGVYPSVLSPAVAIGEGEAAVYTRAGDGFGLVDRIEPDEWAALGAAPAHVVASVVSLEGPGGTGSAFRVAVPGILVTSARLVAGAGEVTVVRPDGRRVSARVLGVDREVDIAALRLADDTGLPPLHSGSGLADARVGDPAFAVGAAGVGAPGPIRALDDPVTVAGGGVLPVIHIDADMPATSAGGPLVNTEGLVLGVLTSATDADALVAIPVHIARAAALAIVRSS